MRTAKIVLSALAFVSAVGGVVASNFNALTNKAVAFPAGQGYDTIAGTTPSCRFIVACPGGDVICTVVTTSGSTTLRNSSVFNGTHCGATLGQN